MEREMCPSKYMPYDPDIYVQCFSVGQQNRPIKDCGMIPFEYTGWWDEMIAQQTGCSIHAGLNPICWYRLKGPDVLKFLSAVATNGFDNFPIGKGKHVILTNEDGMIMRHGIAFRMGEEEVLTSELGPYLGFLAETVGKDFDMTGTDETSDWANYQIVGPDSLFTCEAATGESLRDIEFMHFRDSKIAGHTVRIVRVGMSGTLAYEVHARTEDCIEVYNAILKAGEQYNIKRVGQIAYRTTHTEGGFPQFSIHFTAPAPEAGYLEYRNRVGYWGGKPMTLRGSMGPDISNRFASPVDVGWAGMVSLKHEFPGKEKLAEEKLNPKRKPVTMVWNHEDICDVWMSVFDKDQEPYMLMPLGEDFDMNIGSSAIFNDQILCGDKLVGMSCDRMFSPKSREMLSLGIVDVEYAKEGTELEILWGDPGTRQKRIRATVAQFPYDIEMRNQDCDVRSL